VRRKTDSTSLIVLVEGWRFREDGRVDESDREGMSLTDSSVPSPTSSGKNGNVSGRDRTREGKRKRTHLQ
jgi:hypothetical protein